MCDVYIDRCELYNLVKDCGWVNAISAETILKVVQCVAGERVLSKVGRDYLEKRIARVLSSPSPKWTTWTARGPAEAGWGRPVQ